MKNPSNAYRLLDERTMLETLQVWLNEERFPTDLWKSEDDDGFWSLSIGPYEICMEPDTKTFTVYDFDEKLISSSKMEEIVDFFTQKWES
jgi:hypothetical protein